MAQPIMCNSSGNTATISLDNYTTNDSYQAGDIAWPHDLQLATARVSIYNNKEQEVKDMRGLFHIYVVDYEHDQVIAEGHIVADDEAKAKMKALHKWSDAVANYDLDDLDIICVKLGNTRKKEKIQEVKVVKEA